MKVIAVIPARYGSTRFEGKPLKLILNKPMIQWVYESVKSSQLFEEVYVATDHEGIAQVVNSIGGKTLMTRSDCPTGTDRIYEATQNLDFDVVINVQGDEPLINKYYLEPLVQAFADQKNDMTTLAHPIEASDLDNMNAVKVIKNKNNEAIYFSRFSIPYSRLKNTDVSNMACEKHIGLYGYRKEFLKNFCLEPQAEIEKAESLEQLRALYMGATIKVITVERPTLGVDTPEDLVKVENHMKNLGYK